jgi:hypothetical protein
VCITFETHEHALIDCMGWILIYSIYYSYNLLV